MTLYACTAKQTGRLICLGGWSNVTANAGTLAGIIPADLCHTSLPA